MGTGKDQGDQHEELAEPATKRGDCQGETQ